MLSIPIIGDLIAFVIYGLPNVPGNLAEAWRTRQHRKRVERVKWALWEGLQREPTSQEIIDVMEDAELYAKWVHR